MKNRVLVTVTFEMEIDSDWYQDKDPNKLLDNFQAELDNYSTEIISNQLESSEVKAVATLID